MQNIGSIKGFAYSERGRDLASAMIEKAVQQRDDDVLSGIFERGFDSISTDRRTSDDEKALASVFLKARAGTFFKNAFNDAALIYATTIASAAPGTTGRILSASALEVMKKFDNTYNEIDHEKVLVRETFAEIARNTNASPDEKLVSRLCLDSIDALDSANKNGGDYLKVKGAIPELRQLASGNLPSAVPAVADLAIQSASCPNTGASVYVYQAFKIIADAPDASPLQKKCARMAKDMLKEYFKGYGIQEGEKSQKARSIGVPLLRKFTSGAPLTTDCIADAFLESTNFSDFTAQEKRKFLTVCLEFLHDNTDTAENRTIYKSVLKSTRKIRDDNEAVTMLRAAVKTTYIIADMLSSLEKGRNTGTDGLETQQDSAVYTNESMIEIQGIRLRKRSMEHLQMKSMQKELKPSEG